MAASRSCAIYAHSGVQLPRSTLAAWVGDSRIVVYDFAESRAGKHAMEFMGDWRGALVCDDYSGYKALLAKGMTEVSCMAHARRKFYELWADQRSQIAE